MSYRMHGTEDFKKWCVLLRQRIDCVFEQHVVTLFLKRQIPGGKKKLLNIVCFYFVYKL